MFKSLILIITQGDKNHISNSMPSFTGFQVQTTLALLFFPLSNLNAKFRKRNTMDNNKNETNKSRRSFFTSFLNSKKEKVKMLTADGKLVEVDKAVLDAAGKQKVNNKEILQWMNNPSKNENEI
jgi:hypothetical protein